MKILISLIGMKKSDRSSNAASIKRLLSTACVDSDEVIFNMMLPSRTLIIFVQWVPVIAGLVHEKLFSVSDGEIQKRSDLMLASAVSEIIPQLPSTISEDRFREFAEFQPFESSFFSIGESPDEPPVNSTTNPHFTYKGECPNFVAREEEILAEKLLHEKNSLKKTPLMPGNSISKRPSSQISGGSLDQGTQGGRTHTSLAASVLGGGGLSAKKTVIAVSDSKVFCNPKLSLICMTNM